MIELFKRYILEGVDNSDAMVFKEGVPAVLGS
jgi:hypothetical protein